MGLRVLQLDLLESFTQQKCILPRSKFPADARPGALAKCFLNAPMECFLLCHIYPRGLPPTHNNCYLDNCVSFGDVELGASEGQFLEKLQILNDNAQLVSGIEVVAEITEQLLQKPVVNVNDLKTIVISKLLQSFKLTKGCVVKTSELLKYGISSVHIVAATGVKSPDTFFAIGEDTVINIIDFRLLRPQNNPAHKQFHWYGLERAQEQLEELLQLARMEEEQHRYYCSFNAVLVGPSGSGKSALLSAFVQDKNCNCFYISTTDILGQYPGETEVNLRKIFNSAKQLHKLKPKGSIIIIVEDIHLLCPAGKTNETNNSTIVRSQFLSLVDELNTSRSGIICIATTSAPNDIDASARRPQRFEREVVIEPLNTENRRRLFEVLMEESLTQSGLLGTLDEDILDMVSRQTQGYVFADFALLVGTITQESLRQRSEDLVAVIEQTLKKLRPISVKGANVAVTKLEYGLEKVGGMRQLKRTLEVSVLGGLRNQEAYKRFGLQLPKGILLYGPPGCAKTSLAKCIATEADMNFISTSCAEIYSPYVGCAERYITNIFDTARKHAPSLIFLDEIDALVGSRSGTSSKSHDVQLRVLSILLTEMDGIVGTGTTEAVKQILVVAATNRPDIIDDALLRPGRFDKLVHVPPPDLESRLEIFHLIGQRMPISADVDLTLLAAQAINFSGADVCNLCNEAAIQAFNRDMNSSEIKMEDFEYILTVQKPSLTQTQIDWYRNYEQQFLR